MYKQSLTAPGRIKFGVIFLNSIYFNHLDEFYKASQFLNELKQEFKSFSNRKYFIIIANGVMELLCLSHGAQIKQVSLYLTAQVFMHL